MLNIDKRDRQNEIMFNIYIYFSYDKVFYWPVNSEMKFVFRNFGSHVSLIKSDLTGHRRLAYSSSANLLKIC